MMHKRAHLPGATVTDLFAGAGGSSTGFVGAGWGEGCDEEVAA